MKTKKERNLLLTTMSSYAKNIFELAIAELISGAIIGGIYMGMQAAPGSNEMIEKHVNPIKNIDNITLTVSINRNDDISKIFGEIGRQMENYFREQKNKTGGELHDV